MSTVNWNKIKEIFLEAIELDAEERAAFLEEKCGDDLNLRREVEDLIRADEEAVSLMSRPAIERNADDFFAESADEADSLIGKIIGEYRLTAEIGRGGMGAVFLATRADGEFRRQVAVKLIKRGMETEFILKRFRQERQVLAALNHPGIARLLGGGRTEENLPYFVMEYVEGKPLYRFCDEEKLSIRERLGLFCLICEAVEYAHEKQIVHRDLKPSNILVKEGGAPKLLDFGIAKALDAEIGISTIDPTMTAMRLMTPEYASPEQVSGLPVMTSSDIYSLGVVLYELLTGHRPYRFKSRAPHEIARVICEEEPLRPSTGVTREDNLLPTGASGATLSEIHEARGAESLESLQKELAGEIEKVILKCLRKNPHERYRSAADLAADVTRYLNGERVHAETFPPPTVESKNTQAIMPEEKKAFSFGGVPKFALTLLAALVLGGGLAWYFVFRSEKNDSPLASANQPAAKRSVAILPFKNETLEPENDFLGDGLSENLINRLSYLPEVKIMSRAAAFKYKGTAIAPVEAGREMNVGSIVSGKLTRNADKIAVFLELIDVSDGSLIWSAQYGGKESELVFLQNKMAGDLAAQFRTDKASEPKSTVSRGYTEKPEAFEFYLKAEFERQKGTAEGNRKSIDLYRRALELDADYALAYQGLALACRIAPAYRTLEPGEAYQMAKEASMKALAIDPALGAAYLPLASIKFAYDWDFAGAEKEYRQAIALAPNNPEIHSSYASFLNAMGRNEEALSELKIARQFDPQSTVYATNTAWALSIAGRFDEAAAELKQALNRDPQNARAYSNLGEIYTEQGRFDEAAQALQKAQQLSPDLVTKTSAAYFLAVSGQRAEALKLAADLELRAQKNELPSFLMAEVFAGLGERDRAFYWLERGFQERSNWMVFTRISRRLKPLRGDPRFDDLLKRIGFDKAPV